MADPTDYVELVKAAKRIILESLKVYDHAMRLDPNFTPPYGAKFLATRWLSLTVDRGLENISVAIGMEADYQVSLAVMGHSYSRQQYYLEKVVSAVKEGSTCVGA